MFTGDQLETLDTLISIAESAPNNAPEPLASIWDNIVSQVKKAVEGIVNSAKTTIGGWINGVKTNLTSKLGSVQSVITDWVTDAKQSIKTAVYGTTTTIINSVKNVVEGVKSEISDTVSGIGNAISNAIGWIRDKLSGIISTLSSIGNTIGNSIKNALSNVQTYIGSAINSAINTLGAKIQSAINSISSFFTGIKDAIVNGFNNIVKNVSEWITNAINNIKNAVEAARKFISDTYTNVRNWIDDKISHFIDWIHQTVEDIQQFFWDSVSKAAGWFSAEVLPRFNSFVEGTQAFLEVAEDAWKLLESGDYEGAISLWNDFAAGLGIPSPIEIVRTILSAITYFYLSIELKFIPLKVAAQRSAEIGLQLDPVSLDAAAAAYFRGEASKSDFYKNAYLAGIPKSRAEMVLSASKAILTPGDVQKSFLRGLISEKEHDKALEKFGFSEHDITLFKTLYFFIPPAQDLIRMSVREVFTPDIAEKFGQFENFPEVFADFASQQGVSRDWALAYWAAHWDLPSPNMGFEMFHRGIIDENELKLLLRALDVMPYWRERLIKLSYNPLTRVDVRRMYKLGVLDEQQVYRAYLDLGYSPESAENMLEFTKRYSAPEDASELDEFRALARSAYSQAFKKRIISEDEYLQFLINMGYHPDDAHLLVSIDAFTLKQNERLFDYQDYRKDWQKLILQAYDRGLLSRDEIEKALLDLGYEENEVTLEINLVDYNRQLLLRNLLVKQVSDQYITWTIDETQVYEILNAFGFTSDEIEKLQEEWNIERHFRTRKPSITDLQRFFKSNLISLDELLNELRGLGYNERYIPLYQEYLAG